MTLSLKKMLMDIAYRADLIADYIIEEGKSGIWTYRKRKSGIAELWGTVPPRTVSISTAWAGWYYHNNSIPPQEFPFEFEEIPSWQFSPTMPSNGSGWYILMASKDSPGAAITTKATGSLCAVRPSSHTNALVGANLYVVGRYKTTENRTGGGYQTTD